MADPRRYTLNIGTITQGGKPCVNPTITAHIVGGLTVPCPYENGVIELVVDPTANIHCVDFVIDCEDCEKCPPQVIRRCLCETSDECQNCENCINGWCVPYCPDSKFCDDGICVDCLDDTACPCDQVCVNGKCQCPNNKPYKDSNGCCHECIDGQKRDGFCEICVGGKWVAIICPNSYPDPETCECKECINSGHCPPNQCCVDGKCQCCPGYYFDPASDSCIPLPKCQRDTDCPPCHQCVNNECQPIPCPSGYKTIGSNCCARECDCDNPSCPQGQSCYRTSQGCICVGCEGPCITSDDCDPACKCSGNNCVPNSCNKPCVSGLDCDTGCGCLNNNCVPCEGSCIGTPNSDCEQKDGCQCQGNTCVGDPCNKRCIEADDCDKGCGCQSNSCIGCDTVPCVTNSDCPFGCYCDKGISLCKANPCPDPCSSGADCGPGCGCFEGHCYPCSSFDCPTQCEEVAGCECVGTNCTKTTDCDDELAIEKLDASCQLKGTLTTKDCCECPNIGLDVSVSMASKYVTVETFLRKGLSFSDTRLGSTGVVNDVPISGTARVTITQNLVQVGNSSNTTTKTLTFDFDYGGIDNQNFAQLSDCNQVTISGLVYNVVDMKVEIEGLTPFIYANECRSTLPKTTLGTLTCASSTLPRQMLTFNKVVRCATPLFTWYKGNAISGLSIFRRFYASRVTGNNFQDIIGVTEGVEACKFYKLTVNCGCDLSTMYSCYGSELSPTKLNFCNPTDITVDVAPNTCNKDICIREKAVCAAMEGKIYTLYINGVIYDTYTVTGGVLFAGDVCFTHSEPVVEVKLVFPCDDCNLCTIRKTIAFTQNPCTCSLSELAVTANFIDCNSGITYVVTNGTAPYNIVVTKNGSEIYNFNTSTSPYNGTIAGPLSNGLYVVTVTDAYGCVKTANATATGCCTLDVLTASYNCATSKINITYTGGSGRLNLSSSFGSGIQGDSGGNNTFSVPTLTNGTTYTLTFTDANGCIDTILLTVDCCPLFVINSAILDGDCDSISVSLSGGTAPYQYKIDNGSYNSFNGSSITLGAPLTFGTHTLTIKDSANCTKTTNINCTDCSSYVNTGFAADYDCSTGCFVLNTYTTNPAFVNPINFEIRFQEFDGTFITISGPFTFVGPYSFCSGNTQRYADGTPVTFTFTDGDGCLISTHVRSFNKIVFSESYDCINNQLNINVATPGAGYDIYVDNVLQPPVYVPIPLSNGSHTVKVTDGYCDETHTILVNCTPPCDLSSSNLALELSGVGVNCSGTGVGCCYRITNNHLYTVNFEIYNRAFSNPCDPPSGGGYSFVESFTLTSGASSSWKGILDNKCMMYTAIKASDPTCRVDKGFSCP